MSFKLWIAKRSFPLLPVIDTLPTLKSPFDLILIIILILVLSTLLIYKERKIYVLALGLLFFILIQDQLRWQPWVYMYTLMLVPFSVINNVNKSGDLHIVNYLQIMMIGIYFWCGIHKLNPDFIDGTFESILTDFFQIKNPGVITDFKRQGYSIPLLEIFIGIALLIPRFRTVGVCLSMGAHLFILFYLTSYEPNQNSIVYPWNVAMMIFVSLLFYRMDNKIVVWRSGKIKIRVLNVFILLFVGVLPVLNFVNCWDSYLSFSLYSDKTNLYYIVVEEKELVKMDKRYSGHFVDFEGAEGKQIMNVSQWCLSELNVPFYPERRVFKSLSKDFCRLGIEEFKLVFLEWERPLKKQKYYSFTCKEVVSE